MMMTIRAQIQKPPTSTRDLHCNHPRLHTSAQPPFTTRRTVAITFLTSLCFYQLPAIAAPLQDSLPNKEVDNDTSPLVQEMLRKTREKAAERKVERLNDYYRRNYGDYFAFQAGSNMEKQGMSKETADQIRQWLKENNTTNMPGLKQME